MNSGLKALRSSVFSPFSPIYIPVRFRYWEEKVKKGPTARYFGYKDKIERTGILPRLKDEERLPGPIYVPKNPWSHERATFGQNDYIDILGDGKLKPVDVSYDVPKWLRGKKGNEFSLLLLKQKTFYQTPYYYNKPKTWHNISKRVKHLYRHLNYKTKTSYSNK